MKIALPLLAIVLACAGGGAQTEDHLARRWLYLHINMLPDRNVAEGLQILDRAAAVGYNGVVFQDFKLSILGKMPESYFANARKLRDRARALKMTVISPCMNLGWSSGLLYHNPNLAEGMPVKDQAYVVAGGELRPVHDPAVGLPGGDFETVQDGKFGGWSWYDDPGQTTFPDSQVVHSGQYSARMQDMGKINAAGNCRFNRRLTVKPFHYYRLSAWIKSQDFSRPGNVALRVLAGEKLRSLTYADLPLKATQDWTEYRCVFNSLEFTQVGVYVGVWGGQTGTLWWDDLKVEEVGPLNILRRDKLPLVVKAADGTVYEEGQDFARVEDPLLSKLDQVHEAPVIKLSPTSRLRDGQQVLVSFYHPGIIGVDDVMACVSAPETQALLRDQVQRAQELLAPDVFFMGHDEIRCLNWDPPCQERGLTAGQLLADNARWCVKTIRELAPQAEIAVWNDMFDPFHNAVEGPYYLVNGSLKGSWEGLDPAVTIMNWYAGPAPNNNRFWADRGHKQVLCGYYDVPPAQAYDPAWLAKTKGIPGILGVMYTPWSTGYENLEAWARVVWGGQP